MAAPPGRDVLDLRPGRLTAEQLPIARRVIDDARAPFDRMLAEASAGRQNDPDWWASAPISRNTYASPFFRRCWQIALVGRLARSPLRQVVTDDAGFARTLRRLFPDLAVRVEGGPEWAPGRPRQLASAVRWLLRRWRAGTGRLPKLPAGPLTLVDQFVFDGDLGENRFGDRYYMGMDRELAEPERRHLWRVPTWYDVRDIAAAARHARAAAQHFLLKEDVLRLSDYAFALAHAWRLWRKGWPRMLFQGVDVTALAWDEARDSAFGRGTLEALLNYRFCRRLAQAGVRVRFILDWFEGQQLDKCLHLGRRHFLPGVRSLGYQGSGPRPAYLCFFPSAAEVAAGVVPDAIATTGEAFAAVLRANSAMPEVRATPSFRFQAMRGAQADAATAIAVPLPVSVGDARAIVAALEAPAMAAAGGGLCYELKLHPTHSAEDLGLAAPPPHLRIVQDGVGVMLQRAAACIAIGSNTCVEAMAAGVPVILPILTPEALLENPVPPGLADDMVAICEDGGQLAAAVSRFVGVSAEVRAAWQGVAARKVVPALFLPVDRAGVAALLELDGGAPC